MEISPNLPGVGQTLPLRTAQRVESTATRQPSADSRETGTADVRVSISAQARAAESVERAVGAEQLAAAVVNRVPGTESDDPVATAERLEAPRGLESANASADTSAASSVGQASSGEVSVPVADRTAMPEVEAQGRAREPDAPTTAKNPAVELYLANASQPETRPAVAPIRASA